MWRQLCNATEEKKGVSKYNGFLYKKLRKENGGWFYQAGST